MAVNKGKVEITATFKDEVSQGVQKVDRGFQQLQGTINVLRSAGLALLARELVMVGNELAILGAKATATAQVFDRLARKAGTDAAGELERLRYYTKGTISDLQLMQKVGAAVDAGLTFDQAATAVRFLRAYSTAFGKEFNQLMQTIFTGLQRGSVLFLDDAGIILSASDAMFDGLNDVEKKSALVGEAIRLMTEKLPDLETAEINAAEKADQLAAAWENARAEIGQALSPLSELASTLLTDVLKGLDTSADAAERFRGEVEKLKQLTGGSEVAEEITKNNQLLNMRTGILDIQREINSLQENNPWLRSIHDEESAIKAITEKQKEQLSIQGQLARLASEEQVIRQRQAGFSIGERTKHNLALESRMVLIERERRELQRLYDPLDQQRVALQDQLKLWQQMKKAREEYNEAADPMFNPALTADVQAKARGVPEPSRHLVPDLVPDSGSEYGADRAFQGRLDAWVDFFNALQVEEAKATADRQAIFQAELKQRMDQLRRYAEQATDDQEEIERFLAASEKNITATYLREENDRVAQKQAQTQAQHQQFVDQITRAELEASGDRVALAKWETGQWLLQQAKRLVAVDGNLEDWLKVNQIYQDRLKQIEGDAAKKEEETHIRRILLIFNADVNQVKDAADLAAYSVGLFAEQLGDTSSAAKTAIAGLEQVWTAFQSGYKSWGMSEGLMGGAAAGGAVLWSMAMNKFAADAAHWRQEVQRLSGELEDAARITGAYAREVAGLNIEQQKAQFRELAEGLAGTLGGAWGQVDWTALVDDVNFTTASMESLEIVLGNLSETARNTSTDRNWIESQNLTVRTTFEQLNRLGEGIRRFSGDIFTFQEALDTYRHGVALSDIQDPVQKMALLTDALTGVVDIGGDMAELSLRDQRQLRELIADLEREKTQAEVDARMESAKVVVDAIREQEQAIERAMDDALAAQRQASLRAVRLSFDVQEAALRQTYVSRFRGAATDPLEQQRLLTEAQREIEILALAEAAAATSELAELNASFDAARDANKKSTDLQVAAIERAAQDTSSTFQVALDREMAALGVTLDIAYAKATTDGTAEVVGAIGDIRVQDIINAVGSVQLEVVDTVTALSESSGKMDLINSNLKSLRGKVDGVTDAIEALTFPVDTVSIVTAVEDVKASVDALTFPEADTVSIVTAVGDVQTAIEALTFPAFPAEVTAVVDMATTEDLLTSIWLSIMDNGFYLYDIMQVMLASVHTQGFNIEATRGFGEWIRWITYLDSQGFGGAIGGSSQAQAASAASVTVNVTVNGGGQDKTEIRRMYKDELEPLIVESLIPGGVLSKHVD